MSHSDESIFIPLAILAVAALIWLWGVLDEVGSPALPLSVVSSVAWIAGRRQKKPLIRSAASAAAALSLGFGVFAALYIVLAHRSYADAMAWAQAGEWTWAIETALVEAREFLHRTFGSAAWLCLSMTILIALFFISARFRSSGAVSKFGRLQERVSFLNSALIAATTFTVLLPLGSGEVLETRFNSIREGIQVSLRRTEEAASRTLAAEIVASNVRELPEGQQQQYQLLINRIAAQQKTSANDQRAVAEMIRSSTEVSIDRLTVPVVSLRIPSEPSERRVALAGPSADPREVLQQALNLERRATTLADEEQEKAVEGIVASLFTAATPELNSAVGAFVGILVDTISGPISERVTQALEGNGSDHLRIRRLAELLMPTVRVGSMQGIVSLAAPQKENPVPSPNPVDLTITPPKEEGRATGWPTEDLFTGLRSQDRGTRRTTAEDPMEAQIRKVEKEARDRGIPGHELVRQRQRMERQLRESGPRER